MNANTPQMPIVATDPTTTWGTANLDLNAKITIHVGSASAVPISACLIHTLVLGRFEGNDPEIHVNLQDYAAAEKGVSRQHASLTRIAKNVMLTDLDSKNGTFLNGYCLSPNKPCVVRDGDEIRLGQLAIYISYENPSAETNSAITG